MAVELLVAYQDDPAGSNMAEFLARDMELQDGIYRGGHYDLVIIPTPAISADWLDRRYDYDGFVFLSKHAAESGVLALTCHSTGNFAEAKFGGNDREVAFPHPVLQKAYLQALYQDRGEFGGFQITIEATHHGPTALSKPSMFIEVGTTPKQWTDASLCSKVARVVERTMSQELGAPPTAVCFGGSHYSKKFTDEVLEGEHAIGTVVPRHALGSLDPQMFSHIMSKNPDASAALLDWSGLGEYKQKVVGLLEHAGLEVIRL